jgi:hypothetical protein
LQKIYEEVTAYEETYQKADDKITELTAKRNEEQDPDKAQELTKEIQKWMEEARKLNDKITEAQAKSDRALGEWMQAEKEARAARQRHAKTFEAMEQIAPTLQRIEGWRVAFLKDFKPTS